MSTPHRPRKSPQPRCDLREENRSPCAGRDEVVLVDSDHRETRLCPAHAAALWVTTDPRLRFSAKTPETAIREVMRHAFFGGAR